MTVQIVEHQSSTRQLVVVFGNEPVQSFEQDLSPRRPSSLVEMADEVLPECLQLLHPHFG